MLFIKKSLIIFTGMLFLLSCNSTRPKTAFIPQPDSTSIIPFHPFETDGDINILIDEIGDARIVLLGESTHGTHEFYQWRSAITKRLIEEKGFQLIGIEGDWNDTYKVNQFIAGPLQDSTSAVRILRSYERWPRSMWGNVEMAGFVYWLNRYNHDQRTTNKIALYGLDLYSFWKWTFEPAGYADTAFQNSVFRVSEKFGSFENDALKYAAAVRTGKINYGIYTQSLYNYVNTNAPAALKNDFLIQQQVYLALEGERYFRSMVNNKIESWNIRENYMANTILRLLARHGKNSKAVIWVHNGHAGDSRFAQMAEAGYSSVGELLKKHKLTTYSVAFGTNKGEVYAGYYWNAPLQRITVPPARKGSWENILHEQSATNQLVLSREIKDKNVFSQWLPFRSIGAAYSNNAIYGMALLPMRFDALIYIDSTKAILPLKAE